MSADVTKVFIEGMEACTDEQRADIESDLREHNAEAISKEEHIKSLSTVPDLTECLHSLIENGQRELVDLVVHQAYQLGLETGVEAKKEFEQTE